MKMADVLRDMADMLEKAQGDDEHSTGLEKVEINSPKEELQSTMMPPLQQKLEIMKKSAGMDNAFDSECGAPDELDDIKKLTGIKAVVHHVAGEDNDVLG
jgi:hypothetical protein